MSYTLMCLTHRYCYATEFTLSYLGTTQHIQRTASQLKATLLLFLYETAVPSLDISGVDTLRLFPVELGSY